MSASFPPENNLEDINIQNYDPSQDYIELKENIIPACTSYKLGICIFLSGVLGLYEISIALLCTVIYRLRSDPNGGYFKGNDDFENINNNLLACIIIYWTLSPSGIASLFIAAKKRYPNKWYTITALLLCPLQFGAAFHFIFMVNRLPSYVHENLSQNFEAVYACNFVMCFLTGCLGMIWAILLCG